MGELVPASFRGRITSYLATFGYIGQFLSPIILSPVASSLGLNAFFGNRSDFGAAFRASPGCIETVDWSRSSSIQPFCIYFSIFFWRILTSLLACASRFLRISSSDSRTSGGTGVGLPFLSSET